MDLVDVIALQKITSLLYGSGNYIEIRIIPAGDNLPRSNSTGYEWVYIGCKISLQEAESIKKQYVHI